MTITKNSESYLILDTINDKNVTGRVNAGVNGDINMNLSIDDGTSISYVENTAGKCQLNVSYDKVNDPIDYLQTAIASIITQIYNND